MLNSQILCITCEWHCFFRRCQPLPEPFSHICTANMYICMLLQMLCYIRNGCFRFRFHKVPALSFCIPDVYSLSRELLGVTRKGFNGAQTECSDRDRSRAISNWSVCCCIAVLRQLKVIEFLGLFILCFHHLICPCPWAVCDQHWISIAFCCLRITCLLSQCLSSACFLNKVTLNHFLRSSSLLLCIYTVFDLFSGISLPLPALFVLFFESSIIYRVFAASGRHSLMSLLQHIFLVTIKLPTIHREKKALRASTLAIHSQHSQG